MAIKCDRLIATDRCRKDLTLAGSERMGCRQRAKARGGRLGLTRSRFGRPSHGVGPGSRELSGRRGGLAAALPRARDRQGRRLFAGCARGLYARIYKEIGRYRMGRPVDSLVGPKAA
jgi:hypothetical protein